MGLGARRKAKRWGRCTCSATTKEQLAPGVTRIRGNLCNVHGRYGPCDAAQSGKKPKKGRAAAKPKQTPEQRQAQRDTARAAQRATTLRQLGVDGDVQAGLLKLMNGSQPDHDVGGLVDSGLAERDTTGAYRLTANGRQLLNAAGRGDAGAARDAISRARDQVAVQHERTQRRQDAAGKRAAAQMDRELAKRQRQTEQAKRDQERSRAKPAKQSTGGGKQPAKTQPHKWSAPKGRSGGSAPSTGGASGSPSAPKQPAKEQPQIDQKLRNAASKLAEGQDVSDAEMQQLITNGLVKLNKDGVPVLTAAGQRATMKAQRFGGKKRSKLADDVFAGPDRSFPIVTAQDVRDAVASLGRTKHDKAAVKRGIIRRARAIGATDALPESWREKSFAVFKDHTGAYRWIARTTTAYRDRDQEIIAAAALDQDSQRMMATKQFGPLRWWHVGAPDPANPEVPWGPGLDIGDCDYSVLIGRTRVESGTFKSAALAEQVAQIADDLEMSPGFFHALNDPTPDGVFRAIRTFERSVVPTRYGRASNLFTGFTVKESRMDVLEMERRFKAAISELGLSPEQAASLGQQLVQTEKAAAEQGIAFKSDDAPEWARALASEIQTLVARVKALEPIPVSHTFATAAALLGASDAPEANIAEKAMAPASMEQAGATEIADATAEQADDGDGMDDEVSEDTDVIGNMSIADFETMVGALLDARLAPQEKMQDMLKQMNDMHGELKSMYGGTATKEASRDAAILALKSQQDAIAHQLAELTSDQPAVTLPADVEAALKSAGPAVPPEADPSKPVVPTDPNRPFASLAAQTAPWLYSENGWHQSAS